MAIIAALAGIILGLLAGFEMGDRHSGRRYEDGQALVVAQLARQGYSIRDGEVVHEEG